MIKYIVISFAIGILAGMLIMNSFEKKEKILRSEIIMPAETTYKKIVIYGKGKGEIKKDTIFINNNIAEKVDFDSTNNFKAELSYNIKDNIWSNKYSFDERRINTTKIISDVKTADNKMIKYFAELGGGINFFVPERKYEYTFGAGVEASISKMVFSVTGSTVINNFENKILIYPQFRGKVRLEF
ncbi:MAG TPA: hypothetical protein VFF33_03330 [Ignavibacteriaceae bacterium]|nr:hypothetical protein [Ignavibacteriaceae bacterium]